MSDIFDISEAVYNLYSLLYTADIRTNRISLISNAPPRCRLGMGSAILYLSVCPALSLPLSSFSLR